MFLVATSLVSAKPGGGTQRALRWRMGRLVTPFVLLLTLASNAPAQAEGELLSMPPPASRERALVQAQRVKRAGIGITTIGSILTVTGGLLAGLTYLGATRSLGERENVALPGLCLIGVGIPLSLVGAPLWSIGGSREQAAKVRLGLAGNGLVGTF